MNAGIVGLAFRGRRMDFQSQFTRGVDGQPLARGAGLHPQPEVYVFAFNPEFRHLGPLAKDRRSHADDRGAFFDGNFKIVAHPHGKLPH